MSEAIVITGTDNIKAYQTRARLYFWRTEAQSKLKFGMRPKHTIKQFNAMYGTTAKTWQDVYNYTNDAITGE